MKNALLFLFMTLSLMATANGGEGSPVSVISGRVLEKGTTEELTGVKVSIKGTDIFTYTDKYGNYELPSVPVGQVVLEFSLVSFEPSSQAIVLGEGKVSVLHTELESR